MCLNLAGLTVRSQSLSIIASEQILQDPIASQTVRDCEVLLDKAYSLPVTLNDPNAAIQIILPEILVPFEMKPHELAEDRSYPEFDYPVHDFTWNITVSDTLIVHQLEAVNGAGVSNGLYALLQDRLGFAFYHPKRSYIPTLETWPIDSSMTWRSTPRFDKKGFHLHTQHPLELTKHLMMLNDSSWLEVKQYIDWLARNQQNYFEFNLLEGIDRQTWPTLAKRMTDYLHSRGIIAGLDLSLHMIQQKSFMLYQSPPNSFRRKTRQIKSNVNLLFTADWDICNVEFSTTEFTGGNVAKKKTYQKLLNRLLIERDAKLMGRAHVVKKEEMMGGKGEDEAYYSGKINDSLDRYRGIMSHTVMFYTAFEEQAPVYGNENLQHMLDLLLREQQVRETWYYPESAYWITFDNSVPIFLPSYLSARLADIMLMDSLDVSGHLTFSSGWEWGYWLIDWSIARWSWEHEINGEVLQPQPTEFVQHLANLAFQSFMDEVLALHDQKLKEENLIAYLVAQTVTDEMPGPFDLVLHPRPHFPYGYLMNDASKEECRQVEAVIDSLEDFHETYFEMRSRFDLEHTNQIKSELLRGLDIVALRALHRAYTLSAILAYRYEKLDSPGQMSVEDWLLKAKQVRLEARDLVDAQEQIYRYPPEEIARRRWSHTAYHFGYLYPAHDLHFWNREEMQIKKNKWGPLFMKIWEIPRIIGLSD